MNTEVREILGEQEVSGVTVCDLASDYSGVVELASERLAYAGKLFAEMGADVVIAAGGDIRIIQHLHATFEFRYRTFIQTAPMHDAPDRRSTSREGRRRS